MADAHQCVRLIDAFPGASRLYASYWGATREWGVVVRDVNMQTLVEGVGPTLDAAVEDAIAKAPSPSAPIEDLF